MFLLITKFQLEFNSEIYDSMASNDLLVKASEKANGYGLRDLRDDTKAWGCPSTALYVELKTLFLNEDKKVEPLSDPTDFFSAFEAAPWSLQWSIGDAFGATYAGYWLMSRDRLSKDKDATTIRKENALLLHALPFSKPFLIKLVTMGVDCVQSVNTIGVWFQRHLSPKNQY